jgi:Fe-S cluster assembly protein SufD
MQQGQNIEQYLAAFKNHQKNGGGLGPAWLKELRQSAIASFGKLGFPTIRDEDWKYTSVAPIVSTDFAWRERDAIRAEAVTTEEILALSFADSEHSRLVFVDGVYCAQLSEVRGLLDGVRLENLAGALRSGDEVLHKHLSRYVRYQQQSFVALNTAFVEDGVLVFIPQGAIVEQPMYLIFVSTGEGDPTISHPRNLIVADEGAQVRIVESHVGKGNGTYFANAVTEVVVGEGASVEHYLLQRQGSNGLHVGALEAHLSAQCSFSAHSIALAGSLIRNDVHVVLDGEGAECHLNGLYLVDAKRHVDNHTEIEHCRPRARSQELYKGILSGSARGVFNGKILVHKDAQKSDARQTNKNLVLSKDAVINTKPQLEIYADDVKCSHGSTVGQLDSNALFYLQSRGIGWQEAQSLLSYAFASDVTNRIKAASMRSQLDDYLLMKFSSSQNVIQP